MSATSTDSGSLDATAGIPADLLIGGEWVAAASGRPRIAVENPADGEVLAEIADADVADALAALDAAAAAQAGWAATPARERCELLRSAFERLRAERERFATIISLEMGKPLREARAEVDYGAEFLRWYAEEGVRLQGDYRISPDGGSRILVKPQPIGPCLLITPWNFPLAMATRKIAPALAAGCTAILKPATLTPLASLAFAQLLVEVGVPAGVLGILTTSGAGALSSALLADGRIRKVSFTGSTEVGRRLIAASGEKVVATSMELGGNAPFLVFADADLEAAVDGALVAKMRNMGEACTAANRFLVADPVADEFARLLSARIAALRVGPGTDEASEVGPLIDAESRDRVAGLVAAAADDGATVHVGGAPLSGPGYFFEPTVLEGVDPTGPLLGDEIFGPVAPIVRFGSDEEAIELANDTEYGLVSYAYTRDLERALRVADALEAGMVAINRGLVSNAAAPFGGIKQSGLGREGGREGIEDYLDLKYVALDL
ncbi:MAG: NAD-dependent succinate-semialdehyde dehydrogenase [Actinobacteria bacterium]|nr:NAD-dependent succinate-semialdehyde dehydrogenase [Actinomycetota bacterium]